MIAANTMDEPVLVVILLVPLLALAACFMEWTLAPLIAAASTSTTHGRFMLTDLLWLVVQLQIAMALVARAYPPGAPNAARVWGLVALCLPVIAFWFASLQAVSQAGIEQPLKRAAVFVIVLPGSIATFIGVPALAGLLIVSLLAMLVGSHSNSHEITFTATQIILGLACAVVVRNVATWSVAKPLPASKL